MEKLLIVDKVFDLLTKGKEQYDMVEADKIFPIVLYSQIRLGPKDGANLLIELEYIMTFCHESVFINEGF